jgi:hypothetical protein
MFDNMSFLWKEHNYTIDLNRSLGFIQRRTMQSTRKLFASLVKEKGFVIGGELPCQYCYKDNGSDVLLVAHADSVQDKRFFRRTGNAVFSPSLDDRLGVAIVCDILPMIGITCDILITDGEEFGMSSAQQFCPDKRYNWIAEFDRAGDDVVTYDYGSAEWADAIEGAGFRIGHGSYSDVCELYDLGTSAMNVGVGYEKYHSLDAYANLMSMEKNLLIFKYFYLKNKDRFFEHTETYERRSYLRFYGDTEIDDDWLSGDAGDRHLYCWSCTSVFMESEVTRDMLGRHAIERCPVCDHLIDADEAHDEWQEMVLEMEFIERETKLLLAERLEMR